MQIRSIEQISDSDVLELQYKINTIIQAYKNNHAGLFSIFQSDAGLKITLDNLLETVSKIMDGNKLALKKYVEILQALNNWRNSSNIENHDTVIKINTLLIDHLIFTKEAQYDHKRNIEDSLKLLDAAVTEEQDFYDKWIKHNGNAHGTKNDFPIWRDFLLNINERLDWKEAPTLIAHLKSLVGLKEKSQVTDYADKKYGANDENHDNQEGSLQAIVHQAQKELLELNKIRGRISSISIKNLINQLSEPDKLKISLIRELIRINHGNSFGEELHETLNIIGGKLDDLDDIRDNYIDESKLDQMDEKYHLKKQELRNQVRDEQLKEEDAQDVLELKKSIKEKIKPVLEELSCRIKMDDLLNAINNYETSNCNETLKDIVTAIIEEKNQYILEESKSRIFSKALHDAVGHLENEINLMNSDNLLTLASDYMKYFAKANVESCTEKRKYVVEQFLQPLIDIVIDPVRSVFNKDPLYDYCLKEKLEFQVKQIIKSHAPLIKLSVFNELPRFTNYEMFIYDLDKWRKTKGIVEDPKSCKYPSYDEYKIKSEAYKEARKNRKQSGSLDAFFIEFYYDIFKSDFNKWKLSVLNAESMMTCPTNEQFKEIASNYLAAKNHGNLFLYFIKLNSKLPAAPIEMLKIRNL